MFSDHSTTAPALLDVSELDAAASLGLAETLLAERRAVEVDDLRLLSHWAALHGDEPTPAERRLGGRKLVQVGGEGTPRAQDLCIAEIAVARGVHPTACRKALADVLDLEHRLPLTWARVVTLQAEVWVARRVATLTRDLPLDLVGDVDAAIALAIGGQAPWRVFEITQAKILEADPDTHRRKLDDARRRRYVALSRCDEHGLRAVIARVNTGDAIWIDALVDRVADILAPGDEHATRDELRATAFGWLARPAELLALLLNHGLEHAHDPTAEPIRESPPDPDTEGAEVDPEGEPVPVLEPAGDPLMDSRTTAVPADLLETLRTIDPHQLRSPGVVYVHLHQSTLTGETESGVVRMEDGCPLVPSQLPDVLGTATITIRPVIDLNDWVSVNAYEHPHTLKERVLLTTVGDYFPHATGISRRVDFDHPTPYDKTGPPGQTGTHNSGPLTRLHHRAKTHAGYQARQTGPGQYIWRTPHGLYRLVDHHGTHRITPEHGEQLLTQDTA